MMNKTVNFYFPQEEVVVTTTVFQIVDNVQQKLSKTVVNWNAA